MDQMSDGPNSECSLCSQHVEDRALLLTACLGRITFLKKGWMTTVKSERVSYRFDSTSSCSKRLKKEGEDVNA